MIAVGSVDAVLRLDARKSFCNLIRIFDRLVFIVENISCHQYNIRTQCIDFFHHLLHVIVSDAVTQMQICHQNDMKRIQGSSAFFNGDILLCHDRMTCRVDPQYRKCTYHTQADRPHYRMTSSGKQFFLVGKPGPLQNKPQQIRDHDGQNNVQQDPQPVVTDHFQKSLKIRMWQQKCDDNAECQKHI